MTASPLRCATYARYSSDQQREASIVDQQRNMSRYAENKGWRILADYVFSDEGMSGAGTDRPGLQALLAAALQRPKPLDVILVDDTSRISRNLADAVRIREKLTFAGIRLVAVSQGIDSADEQADVMITVHGLVDSLYLKELAKKTHRGLEGLALQGFHTGGNCFGYKRLKVGDRVRLAIDPGEAATIVRIFEMCAAGVSLRKITKRLNDEHIAPPRGSKRKFRSSWVYTAIRAMLRRELYIGRLVWNQRKYIKKPGTNKRVSVPRPAHEWTVLESPNLRIVPQELWERVQQVLSAKAAQFGKGPTGRMNRAAGSKYIFSGILKCAQCGSNLSMLSFRGRGRNNAEPRIGYYGCPGRYHGICSNNVYERHDVIESKLLSGIRERLLDSSAIAYTVAELAKGLAAGEAQQQAERLSKRQVQLREEMTRIADAIAQIGGSEFLIDTLRAKENESKELDRVLAEMARLRVPLDRNWLTQRVTQELETLPALMSLEPERAKMFLLRHVQEIWMVPVKEKGRKQYIAEGEWLIGENKTVTGALLNGDRQYTGSIAGGGFEPPTFGL